MRKTRHLIRLKKGIPVILIGVEGTVMQYFTGDFPILFLTLLCMYDFTLKRMKLLFLKVTEMNISNSLRNTKLLGFSEVSLGWDELTQSKLHP